MNRESMGRNNWDNRREDSNIGHWGGPPVGTSTGEPKPEQQWGSANMDKPQVMVMRTHFSLILKLEL